MGRNIKLSALDGNYDKRKACFICEDLSVLEAPFYLMERVEEYLRASTPQAECQVQPSSKPIEQFGRHLGRIAPTRLQRYWFGRFRKPRGLYRTTSSRLEQAVSSKTRR